MTDAMEVLFSYAQDYLEPTLLLATPQFAESQHCADKKEQQLRALLSAQPLQCLDDFLEERKLLLLFEKQALFRAGFQIAMELAAR